MSLTRLIRRDDELKKIFKKHFGKPSLPPGPEIKAPPLTQDYSIVGNAFDYLLRFEVARLNSNTKVKEKQSGWVAEKAVDLVRDENRRSIAEESVRNARRMREKYLSDGDVSDGLLRSVIRIGRLDPILRAHVGHENIGKKVKKKNLEDLRELISHIPEEEFIAEDVALLNPSFGRASALVGGADADLIIDDQIIEIKTSKNWRSRRRNAFNQLLGYYALNEISKKGRRRGKIDNLSIYFSRYGRVHKYKIGNISEGETTEDFLREFKERCIEREREISERIREREEGE